ncbi:MAG TPA: UDP-N-acetylglucosamine 2-epimerase (non-hydrolyzing) [Rhizomicrobium sp.]|nr:UDP-N-acetylglucosamine 2-epimerase (non-hydrolyzing) [Rhizomicrobium sp.]
MKKILVFAGTRPEAIKMVPVVRALRAMPDAFQVSLCASGQHREMLDQAFADFALKPDVDLGVMAPAQTLASLSSRLFRAIDELLEREKPDAILVQGDTTTAEVAALCAFYRRIPLGHVEAGLRSHDLEAPFPEEMNRRVISMVGTWHFAPTELAKQNLVDEKVPPTSIYVTGNTVIDALLEMRERIRKAPPALPPAIEAALSAKRTVVLITGHRRESFGRGFENICEALKQLAEKHKDISFVYPVHLNPAVGQIVRARLDAIPNIVLETPLSYKPFVRLMDASKLLLTDSGGLQEEGPSLGKPVLIMRAKTERPEGVAAGVNKLVGTDVETIVSNVDRLLADDAAYKQMASTKNPYGDGTAGQQIADILLSTLADEEGYGF